MGLLEVLLGDWQQPGLGASPAKQIEYCQDAAKSKVEKPNSGDLCLKGSADGHGLHGWLGVAKLMSNDCAESGCFCRGDAMVSAPSDCGHIGKSCRDRG